MKLYDTLTRSLKAFDLPKDQPIKIYTCGPTVYDYPHIGNWYSFIRWDILARTLIASGYKINWVMNITDVGHLVSDADEGEDKLQKGARREGKTAQQIADFYSAYFIKGLERLNFIEPTHLPRATDYISQQIDFIKQLESKSLAYKIDDGIYFDTSKVKDYGKLARLNIESLKAGARVEYNQQKRNPTDFALWKFSPNPSAGGQQRDMEWDSPWGKGFPGWHLECSAIAKELLGDTIDIHAGGIDHLPVHHPNEIAQSESLTSKPLAKFWLHSNFIKVNNTKMSKSLGNLITLEDIETKGFSLQAFRLLVLESHYRSEAQFTWDTMAAAQNRLNTYRAMAQLRFQSNKNSPSVDFTAYESILFSLQNDLNSPVALQFLSGATVKLLENGLPQNQLQEFTEFIEQIDNLLGLKLLAETDVTDEQKALIAQRETARKNNNWPTSDKIRAQLIEQGIELRDTTHGPIWNRL